MTEIESIEVVADRTEALGPTDGFLQLKRLSVRNHYADGSASEPYACDIISRRRVDAVAVVLYDIGADGVVRVALKEGVRPPIWLRKEKDLIHREEAPHLLLAETPAGMLEASDDGPDGIERRAAAEALEEVGVRVAPGAIESLGDALFPSPGITDERVHFRCARADLEDRVAPTGDGSVMEEAGGPVVLPLDDAIARCRDGRSPDMKTEVALLRLRDHLASAGA